MKKHLLVISFLLSVTFVKAQINLDSNLVLYYPFNGNANDSSGNQINGILINGPTYTSDHLGNPNSALLFDGVDDFVLSDPSIKLDSLVEPFTITSWVRIDGWYLGSWAALISKSIFNDVHFQIVINSNYLYWLAPYPSCGSLQGTNLPPLNNWFYFTLIQDTNNIRIYVDGVLTDTFTCTGSIVTNSYPMMLGKDTHGSTEYFSGAMDEVRIYNRALLPQEVAVLTGINSDNPAINNFAIFPNPAANELIIQLNENLLKFPTIEIFNAFAETVLTETLNTQRKNIDVGTLPSGVYFIKIQNESGAFIEKFIKL